MAAAAVYKVMNTQRTPPPLDGHEDQPAWVLLALGCLFASISLDTLQAPRPPASLRGGPAADLRTASPLELRHLPGIGPARAAAIAEFRWQRAGAPFELHEIPGIGLATERRVLNGS